jgi:uncharacterized repeat protein (TIGR01451 family)
LRAALAATVLVVAGSTSLASAVPAVDGNPDLPPTCGLDVTLVIDDSASISTTEAGQMRDAAQRFADALVGTPSRLKVVVFSTRAEGVAANGSLTSTLGSVVFRDPALYTAPTSGGGSGGTNWDDGLEVARRSTGGAGDLLVFLTDGDPTYRNTTTPDGHLDAGNHSISGTGSSTSASDLAHAVTEANLIKASGTHLFGIGIGLTAAASEQRLNDVTGDEELVLTGGVPNYSFGEADYTVAPSFNQLEDIVSAFVRNLCAPSVNVTKHLQNANGTTTEATAGDPWSFSATVTPTPTAWQTPVGASGATAAQLTNGTGGASFKWSMLANSATVDLAEQVKPGWVYNGARCERNLLDGSPPTVIFDTVGANAPDASGDQADLQDIEVGLNEAVNCDVYNRQIRTSTIQVTKQTVPAGLADEFSFELSAGGSPVETLNGVSHGETATFAAVAPGTYTVTEAAKANFTQTLATCDDLGTQAVEQASPTGLVVGEGEAWRCAFVNTAAPGSIQVVKDAVGADGSFDFTSNVPGLGDFSLSTVGGSAQTQVLPVPVGTYAIAEQSPAPWQLTGATCTGQQAPGSVFVGPGQAVVCTFTNAAPAPTIAVTKTAGASTVSEPGGPAAFTVNVTNTSVEPLEITTITDSIDGGPAIDVTQVAAPVTATDCDDLIGLTLAPTGPLSSASCTFTATVGGNGGASVSDEVTVVAVDSDANQATDSDQATVRITDVDPAISVTKAPSVASIAEPGGLVTYTVGITNDGVEDVEIDAISDAIEGGAPFSVTSVAPPVTATTCGSLIGTTLAPDASTSCTFTISHVVDLADLPDGDIDDVVTVLASDDDGEVSATAEAAVVVTDALPVISVTKTATPSSVAETAPGQTRPVAFLVTIQNDSVEPVTIDAIVDSIEGAPAVPAGGTCAALIGTTLAPQAGASCTFTLGVAGNAGDVIGDVVTVTASDDDGNTVDDDDPASVTLTNLPSSIVVTKDASVGSVPEPGGPVTFTATITNTSAADSVTIGSITDAVDGGAPVAAGGTCPSLIGQTLVPGAEVSCTFTVQVSGNAGDVVGDTVVVTGTDDDGSPVDGSADEQVAITDVPSSIVVTKTAGASSVDEPGAPVTYTVTIENTSAADAVTIDAITDSVDGGAPVAVGGTCAALVGTTLAPGAEVSCTFTMQVSGNAGDVVGDTVTVTGTDDDDEPVSGSASAVVDVRDVPPSGTVTKTASPGTVPEPGGVVTFTVVVENTSAVEAATITAITDLVDGEAVDVTAIGGVVTATTCATGVVIGPGGTHTCTFSLQIAGTNAGDVVVDEVRVTLADDDGGSVTPSDTETVTVTDVLPTISVTKDNGGATLAAPGGPVSFDVTVTNTGTAEPVVLTALTDAVDGGAPFDITTTAPPVLATSCELGGSIAPGDTYSCSFTIAVTSDEATSEADVVDAVAVDDEGNEATAGDGAVTTITASADVAMEKRVAEELLAGETGTYELEVTNLGPSTAANLLVTDELPAGLSPVSAAGDGWACGIVGQLVTCERPSLAPGSAALIALVVDVDPAMADQTMVNVAEVAADTPDPDLENNRDEVATEVVEVEQEIEESTTTTTTAPSGGQAPTTIDQGTLPRTGGSPAPTTVMALVLLGLGAMVLLVRRQVPRTR